jgi:hypothetical protein
MRGIIQAKMELAKAKRAAEKEAASLRKQREMEDARTAPPTDEGDLIRMIASQPVSRGTYKGKSLVYAIAHRKILVAAGLLKVPPVEWAALNEVARELFGTGKIGEERKKEAGARASQVGIFATALPEKQTLKGLPNGSNTGITIPGDEKPEGSSGAPETAEHDASDVRFEE